MKVWCNVANASLADVDQWLAHHATGTYHTEQHYQYEGHRRVEDYVVVYLDDPADRLKLRDAFDILKMQFKEHLCGG